MLWYRAGEIGSDGMGDARFVEYLMHFGVTRQEALVYWTLLVKGKQTGYEVAKEAGISRSNAYSSLAGLVEKGAAYLVEESAKRYIPVALEEFCENCIRRMKAEEDWMVKNLPVEPVEEEGYITIEGEGNIEDKIRNLLMSVRERVYISCSVQILRKFEGETKRLAAAGKKVVVITDGEYFMDGATVYVTGDKGWQIGLITDSKYVLSGEYGAGSLNTCLYSGQNNFVMVFKTALANEIKLIEMRKGENQR
ncbi:helix-turn-helix domain-containing protein [Faecalicatena contorta]